ncbi:hypothetical protein B5X24_HaOG211796 [Helicoverpa armigera]|uniref:Uncharacterized protein n=1 Tax=Helicoverpa armigera TaxID=29058 RepID=A0A2W1BCM8_HELAM|nr:hypothetical protein B5X24_HaOG211796 [Helicoverpa armigera]
MNGDAITESPRRALWERLGCARGVCARLCRRRARARVAPTHGGSSTNRLVELVHLPDDQNTQRVQPAPRRSSNPSV